MCQIHFPDLDPAVVRCGACHAEPKKEPKPDNWYREPSSGATVDETDVTMLGLIAGHICPNCMTSRHPIGCTCSRNALGIEDLGRAEEFLAAMVEHSEFTSKEAGHMMTSTVKRAVRRMELSEEDVHDLRSDAKRSFGLKPGWFPPRNTEPTHLPV